jgi:uncharacterized membrane protein YgaE (UPF0421/DUF939 family)
MLFSRLRSFSLSEKFTFAVKAALSIVLVYLISFTQGWEQAQTAAITIMLIAVAGPVSESVTKGLRRVAGTIIGALIGMLLIGLFPQDRELYLVSLSVFVTIALYLTRAYRGDMTVFMLTAVTMMMVFKNGEVDDVFLYGIDRTFMTVLGITVFTVVGIFLWPVKAKDDTVDIANDIVSIQEELYRKKDAGSDECKSLYETLRSRETSLKRSVTAASMESSGLNRAQRNTLLRNVTEINELLMLLSYHDKTRFSDSCGSYVTNFEQADREIKHLFASLQNAFSRQIEIAIPAEWKAAYDKEAVAALSHTDRGALVATVLDIQKLHARLRALAEKFNAILSPYPTRFELSRNTVSAFNWLDVEDLKGTFISFLIFWTTTIFWIVVNPPAGFLIVTLATALSVLTTYSPLKPSLLIILFTLSFIFAAAMYILVLPNIHYGWELGLFIFLYAFIGYYFINPKIAIFFLLGMAVLGLANPMMYNLQLFLMTLLVLYLFLFVLLLFYYVPFSTKPEALFTDMKKRFFRLAANLIAGSDTLLAGDNTLFSKLKGWYARQHLMATAKKMQLWASKIDAKYFDSIDREALTAFTKECETFAYFLLMMYRKEIRHRDNRLIRRFLMEKREFSLYDTLLHYTRESEAKKSDSKTLVDDFEGHLSAFFARMKSEEFSREELEAFYEFIGMRRSVWIAFFNTQSLMEKLDFDVLTRSRF